MNITTDQQFPNVTVAFADSQGRPAPVDGVPVWASSDSTVISVAPSPDGMSAIVASVAPGTARVTVSADADLGAGVVPIIGVSEDIVVTNGNIATVVALVLGTPVAK